MIYDPHQAYKGKIAGALQGLLPFTTKVYMTNPRDSREGPQLKCQRLTFCQLFSTRLNHDLNHNQPQYH